MLQTSLHDYRLMAPPAEFAGRTDIVTDGAVLRNLVTGRVEGHLQEVARLPSALLQSIGSVSSVLNLGVSIASFAYMRSQFNALNRRLDQIEHKIDVIDRKLDVLVGMVQQVDQKVDALAHALANVAGQIDSRHRDDVFAEIGAVLDTMAYADRKSPQDAATLVASNITPARKAIRRYLSLVDEYEAPLAASDPARSEIIRMRFLAGILTIKLDLAMGEKEAAHDQALQLAREVSEQSKALLSHCLTNMPLIQLSQALPLEEVVNLCLQMEIIDNIPPTQRMARSLSEQAVTVGENDNNLSAEWGDEWTTMRSFLAIEKEQQASNLKVSTRSPAGRLMSISYDTKTRWDKAEFLKKPGDYVRRGEVMMKIDLRIDDKFLSGEGFATCEYLSPIDGTIVENLTVGQNSWSPMSPIFRIAHFNTSESADQSLASQAPAERPALLESIGTLARIVSAAHGAAVESALLAHQATPEVTNPFIPSTAVPFEMGYRLLSSD